MCTLMKIKFNNLKVTDDLYPQCLTQTLFKTISKSYTKGSTLEQEYYMYICTVMILLLQTICCHD